MDKKFKSGDRVQWRTPQGATTGTVKKKVTGRKRIKGHVAKASKQNPEYLVESEKSGKRAIHKPGELRKIVKRSR